MTHALPTIGQTAPDFNIPNQEGQLISLSSLLGKKVVLYFYPKDDTPGCTIEAKDFRDLTTSFAETNTVILGVSKDSIKKHCSFISKYDLNFTLLSDEKSTACETYGVWVEKSMYGKKYMGIERATYLIDEAGIIVQIWRNVKVTDHAKEVLSFTQGLAKAA